MFLIRQVLVTVFPAPTCVQSASVTSLTKMDSSPLCAAGSAVAGGPTTGHETVASEFAPDGFRSCPGGSFEPWPKTTAQTTIAPSVTAAPAAASGGPSRLRFRFAASGTASRVASTALLGCVVSADTTSPVIQPSGRTLAAGCPEVPVGCGGTSTGLAGCGGTSTTGLPPVVTDRTTRFAASQRSRYSAGSPPHALTNSTVVDQLGSRFPFVAS